MSTKAKKFKVFMFAPENGLLKSLLSQYNNVREARYITPKVCEPYMRVRVRKCSNSVVGIAKQLACSVSPIVEYAVGEDQGGKQVGTIRISDIDRFNSVVGLVQEFCRDVWESEKVFFTCRVSKVVARTENANSWVEIFAVERREVPRVVWQDVVKQLASAIGGEAQFYSASVTEY